MLRHNAAVFGWLDRATFLSALRAEGISCSKGYGPLHRTNAIRERVVRLRAFVTGRETEHEQPDCPVTAKACDAEGVWLAQNVLLGTQDDTDDIGQAVQKIKEKAGSIARGA